MFSTVTLCGAETLDHISLREGNEVLSVSGRVVMDSVDGGVLLEDRAGMLWAVEAERLEDRQAGDAPFTCFDADEMSEHLRQELGPGFRFHTTAHYVICYNTSQDYARWCGALFERLYLAFTTFWGRRDLELEEPGGPLVALVFDSRPSYARYAKAELGNATGSTFGYYSLRTNRMTMYDLTGMDAWQGNASTTTAARINRLLARPEAERTVATIIHEATHQLAFNCGLQTRYADIPLWVSEGIAVYFETPDLKSRRGWRNIGGVNRVRLAEFRRYLPRRPRDSLRTLIRDNERFRNTQLASAAYGEAWALNYFLVRQRLPQYVAYLKAMSEKRPLIDDSPEERLAEFAHFFGGDLERFDVEFLRYMRTVR
jgi:hypothetical protein